MYNSKINQLVKLITVISSFFLLISITYGEMKKNSGLSQQQNFHTKQIFSILADNRPTDYEYAVLSNHIYEKNIKQGDIVKIGKEKWQVIVIKPGGNDYYGVIYQNFAAKQLVLVHRGTNSFQNVIEDLQSVVLKQISLGQEAAYILTKEALSLAIKNNFHLSSTGHSLGALFAELSVYWCHESFGYHDINAVTFESPGSKDLIERRLVPNLSNNNIHLEKLDIVQYLSYPNIINSFGHHIGTVYQLQPMLNDISWVPGWFTKKVHSMSNIVKLFETDVLNTRILMQDWPLGSQRSSFFKASVFQNDKYFLKSLNNNKEFELYYKGHYMPATDFDHHKQILLRHFHVGTREFLNDFFQLHKHLLNDKKTHSELVKYWLKNGVPQNLINLLINFRIDEYRNNKRLTVLSSDHVNNWRQDVTNQLSKHLKLINKLLQPLKQQPINDGLVIIEDEASLKGAVVNVTKFNGDVYKTYRYNDEEQDESKKKVLTSYIPQILTAYEKFVDRQREIKQIDEYFVNHQIVIINGRSGLGKSSLATEYGKYYRTKPAIVRHLNSDSATKIDQEYQEIARELDINVSGQAPLMIMRLIYAKIAELPQNYLFIFDNVEQYDYIKDYITNLPVNIKALITTRGLNLMTNSPNITLEEFDDEAAKEYLVYALNSRSMRQQDVALIINNSGSLPYDLKCISAYVLGNPLINTSKLSLELNGKIKGKLFEEFATSNDEIKQQAWRILQYSAHLDPDFISIEILLKLFPNQQEELSKAIKKLESLSLISIINDQNGEPGFRIHRKLQQSVLYTIKDHPEISIANNEIVHNLLKVFDKLFPEVQLNLDSGWEIARRLAPHIKKVLELQKHQFGNIEHQVLAQIASLYYKMGHYHLRVNINFKDALAYAKMSLKKRYELYNGNHSEIADSLNLLGLIHREYGSGQESLRYLHNSLKVRQRLYSNDHPDIADSSLNIGVIYRELGETEKSLDYAQMALEMSRKIYPENNDIKIARSLSLIGLDYLNLGEFQKSLSYFHEALQIIEAIGNNNHFLTPSLFNNLAYSYYKLGNYNESIKYAKLSLDANDKIYSSADHPHRIYSLRSYGAALIKLNELDEGLNILHEALKISKNLGMEKHFISAFVSYNLGEAYLKTGNYSQALNYAQESLNLRREVYKKVKNHLEIAESLHSLGDIHLALGDKVKALEFYKKSLTMNLALSLSHLPETEELKQKIKDIVN